MEYTKYLPEFTSSAHLLDPKMLRQKQLEVETGIYLNSVVLKLFKNAWVNENQEPVLSKTGIFFSVWVNETSIREQKLLYNIHALKLRQLSAYAIESKKFAAAFRTAFAQVEPEWQNVRIDFGPQTLMQGWVKLEANSLASDIVKLANKFMSIDYLVDETLANFRHKNYKKS